MDTGRALLTAAAHGRELSVKSLLQQQKKKGNEATYVNIRDGLGRTPLLYALGQAGISSPSPRIVRMLIDAGADATSTNRVTVTEGEEHSTKHPS